MRIVALKFSATQMRVEWMVSGSDAWLHDCARVKCYSILPVNFQKKN